MDDVGLKSKTILFPLTVKFPCCTTPSNQVTGNNYYSSPATAVADMDASDTCIMDFFASRSGASGAVTVYNNGTVPNTFLSGYLLG